MWSALQTKWSLRTIASRGCSKFSNNKVIPTIFAQKRDRVEQEIAESGFWQINSEYQEAPWQSVDTYFVLVVDGSRSLDGKNHDQNEQVLICYPCIQERTDLLFMQVCSLLWAVIVSLRTQKMFFPHKSVDFLPVNHLHFIFCITFVREIYARGSMSFSLKGRFCDILSERLLTLLIWQTET